MVGIVGITDQGLSIAGKAQATISGGQLVKAVSGATVLSSTGAMTDVVQLDLVAAVGDAATCIGVAQNTGVSGDTISVATAGIHGLYAAGAIAAGASVQPAGVTTADAVITLDLASTSGAAVFFGKSLSTAASGQLVAVRMI